VGAGAKRRRALVLNMIETFSDTSSDQASTVWACLI
jgi:hypothetical protein